jgi:hypothetical protein
MSHRGDLLPASGAVIFDPAATLGLPHVGASTTFTPRWYINASGVVYAFGSS